MIEDLVMMEKTHNTTVSRGVSRIFP